MPCQIFSPNFNILFDIFLFPVVNFICVLKDFVIKIDFKLDRAITWFETEINFKKASILSGEEIDYNKVCDRFNLPQLVKFKKYNDISN